MKHNVMINYVGKELPEELDELTKLSSLLKMRSRVVTSQAALREKTAIFNLGLDDRVIELMKVIVLMQTGDQLQDKEIGDVLFVEDEGKWYLELVLDGKPCYTGELPREMYDAIRSELADKLGEDNEAFINSEWAVKLLNSAE